MIFHKETREFLEIDIKNQVIIVDEAHNLIGAISDMYSVSLSLGTVCLYISI